ncbi:MAG: hypothetical protein WCK02_09420 [Bacteroidota bacterium]
MIKLYFTSLFLICSLSLFSQENKPNVLDNEYTPPSSSFLGSVQSDESRGKVPSTVNKHSFRFNITDYLHSNIMGLYEYNMLPQLSATFGLGRPVGKDWITWLFQDEMWGEEMAISQAHSDISYFHMLDECNFKSGLSLSATIRFYLCKENTTHFSMPFFEIGLLNIRRSYTIQKYSTSYNYNSIPISNDEDFKTDATSLIVNFGKQWNRGGGNLKFSHEISWGLGLKFLRYDKYDAVTELTTTTYENSGTRIADIIPFLGFTYSIGVGWKKE